MMPRSRAIKFDEYTIDLETRELSYEGREVSLQEKPFRLLLTFLERPGQVVTRAELYDSLWPTEIHVDREAGLNTAVRKLRVALREVADSDHALLQTVPRLGYRLRVEESLVRSTDGPPRLVLPSGEGGGQPATRPMPTLALGVTLAVFLGVIGWLWMGGWPGGPPTVDLEPMPQSPEARASYVEARSLMATMGGDLARARQLLRALAIEVPEFAPAHAYLAEASARLAVRSAVTLDVEEARQAAERALELDSGSAVAHRVLAMVALTFDWDVHVAGERLVRALELDPEDPVTHLAQAAYESAVGRHDRAIEAVRRAVDLEPDSMALRSDAGHFLLRAGRFREAARECEMALRLDPENRYARDCLVTAYSSSGDHDAARIHAVELVVVSGGSESEIEKISAAADPYRAYVSWKLERLLGQPEPPEVEIATYYLVLGDKNRALAWLELAARERRPLLIFIPRNANASRLLGEPRYRELLREAGLDAVTRDLDADPVSSQDT